MNSSHIIQFLEQSIGGILSVEQQTEFLKTVEVDSPEVLTEIVKFLMEKAACKPDLPGAIDFCGTGGSELPRMNTSTPVAFLLAATGVKVAKHGNRASSGRFGSFDLLETLGVHFETDQQQDENIFNSTGLVFLFAQKCHPVMRHFAAARKQIGKPTFFNLLGPLLNPSNPKKQVIGTAFGDKTHLIAETCKLLGKEHVFVIHGSDGLDKATLTGSTQVLELKDGAIHEYTIKPEDFGLVPVHFDDISGSPSENPEFIRSYIAGTLSGPRKDLICLNAAFGLLLAGKVKTLQEGFLMAHDTVDSGTLKKFFQKYISTAKMPSILLKIIDAKKEELKIRKEKLPLDTLKQNLDLSKRDFKQALRRDGKNLIAEIKPSSPSEGEMQGSRISIAHRARIYENEGAAAISVLTDEQFFRGSLENLSIAKKATKNIPLLSKDFIIDPYQIFEARYFGADAILLIAAVLSVEEMNHCIDIAETLGMDALCEVHNEEELEKVLKTRAEIIGINNRDLNDFSVDLQTTAMLSDKIPPEKIIVSESGIYARHDVEALPKRTNAVLIGRAIMKSKTIPQTIHALTGKKPALKICGVQSLKELEYCADHHVDFVGFNFVPDSKRYINPENNHELLTLPTTCVRVGVFQNQDIHEVNAIAEKIDLDYIQLSGEENIEYIQSCVRPVIKAVSITSITDLKNAEKYMPYIAYILLDGKNPGSGTTFNHSILKEFEYPFILAGGINADNVTKIIQEVNPYMVDVASGAETNGERSLEKISQIKKQLTLLS